MSAQHPSRRWKGHCLTCAAWLRGEGKSRRMKAADLRRAGGRSAMKYGRLD